ncbi:MAG TPA: signal peptidase II [Bacteroidota bacterium]|nr:signal peptidase II [Bacteroidota bacterium]
MTKLPRITLILFIVVSFVGCDQTTKIIARYQLANSASVTLINGFAELRYAENEGGFLSVGSQLPFAVRRSVNIALAGVIAAGLILLLASAHKLVLSQTIAYSLLLAGGIGNSIDRLFNHGRVIDFMLLGTSDLHTGIFNVADFLLIISVGYLLIAEFRRRRAPRTQE